MKVAVREAGVYHLSAAAAAEALGVDVSKAKEADAGEILAGRIIEFRQANGPFRSVDELVAVKGIGEASLRNLNPFVTVEIHERDGRYMATADLGEDSRDVGAGDTPEEAVKEALRSLGEPYASEMANSADSTGAAGPR